MNNDNDNAEQPLLAAGLVAEGGSSLADTTWWTGETDEGGHYGVCRADDDGEPDPLGDWIILDSDGCPCDGEQVSHRFAPDEARYAAELALQWAARDAAEEGQA